MATLSTTVNGTANRSTKRLHSLTVTEAEALIRTCRWHELALRRHGFDPERLMRLARKVAHDELALKGAVLGDRFEDLASRLYEIGLRAALTYDPARRHESYGRNGGEPFASYVADIFAMRVTDHFRSKADGFGDRRYGHDNKVDLKEDPDPADHDFDFEALVDERCRARWQEAAGGEKGNLGQWIVTILNIAAEQKLGPAPVSVSSYERESNEVTEEWGWYMTTVEEDE